MTSTRIRRRSSPAHTSPKGLRDLLVGAARRLSGEGGDPVIELQTNFGGGKTHSMIALYHLASGVAAKGACRASARHLREGGVTPGSDQPGGACRSDDHPRPPKRSSQASRSTRCGVTSPTSSAAARATSSSAPTTKPARTRAPRSSGCSSGPARR